MSFSLVACQLVTPCKQFATKCAIIGFFTRMNSNVSIEFIIVAKDFVAMLAAEQLHFIGSKNILISCIAGVCCAILV
jgi:hypothetical protein